jgi:hypothetical protein
MKVKFGAIITDGRGKLGGHYAASNHSGTHLATRKKSIRRFGVSVGVSKTTQATNVQLWATLTMLEQQQWSQDANNYTYIGRMGDTIRLTGQQHFIATNNNLAAIGTAPITIPGAKQGYAPPAFTLTANTGGSLITLTYAAVLPSVATPRIAIYATPLMSTGRSVAFSQYRLITQTDQHGQASDNVYSFWHPIFGNLITGQRLFVKLRVIDTLSGASSFLQVASCVIS